MKRLVLSVAVACASLTVVASPALAQPPGYGAQRWDIDHRIDWLQQQINQGRGSGDLGPGEAARAQGRLNDIREDFRRERFRDGGRLSDGDRDQLNDEIDRLSQSIRWERNADRYQAPWGGAAPGPAVAQRGGQWGGGQWGGGQWDIDHRIDWMQERINHGRQSGDLSFGEANRVQDRLNDIRQDFRRDRFRDGGRLNDADRDQLNSRLNRLAQTIRWERNADQYRLPWGL
jgi:hypothetical protein